MDYQVVWTDPAVADLREITDYIAQNSPAAAERVGKEILKHVELLGSFPYTGPAYPRDPNGLIREIVCRKYRIFYRVFEDDKRVEILTVWHGSRDEPQLPGVAADPSNG